LGALRRKAAPEVIASTYVTPKESTMTARTPLSAEEKAKRELIMAEIKRGTAAKTAAIPAKIAAIQAEADALVNSNTSKTASYWLLELVLPHGDKRRKPDGGSYFDDITRDELTKHINNLEKVVVEMKIRRDAKQA
jgi:hypothetical protein